MSTPTPVPPTPAAPPVAVQPPAPSAGALPNASTVATGTAGAVAALTIMVLAKYGITFPAGAEALLAVVVASIASYIPSSGRK